MKQGMKHGMKDTTTAHSQNTHTMHTSPLSLLGPSGQGMKQGMKQSMTQGANKCKTQ
jgi:hypothetical protein